MEIWQNLKKPTQIVTFLPHYMYAEKQKYLYFFLLQLQIRICDIIAMLSHFFYCVIAVLDQLNYSIHPINRSTVDMIQTLKKNDVWRYIGFEI